VSVFSSLSNRIFLTTALLAVLSIGVAVYRVNVAVTAQAEQELQRGLEEAATLVDNYRRTLLEQYRREARLIADLPKLKAAVYTQDPPTVQPIAADYQAQLGADLFVVSGRNGRTLAAFGATATTPGNPAAGLGGAASPNPETVSFLRTAEGLLEVVSVAIPEAGQPGTLGTLAVGFALDNRAATRLKALTSSEIAFTSDGAVQASTLPRDRWAVLATAAAGPGPLRLTIGEEEYVLVRRSIVLDDEKTSGALAPAAIVLRSRTERLRVLSRVHTALAVTAFVAVLAATGLSYALARTVTRPLGVITSTMREVSRSGDLTRRIPEPPATRWDDEDARLLARTYNTMTESIARFQREAAQRERLLSLGRLSTVIAHEIRNPLMIIKSVIRPLRKESGSSDLRRIADDIEEEIARLNRIVSEVLDFARPIRFELAPSPLNEICRSAALAVWAGEPGWSPDLDLDPQLGTIVTDAERLRQALVNVFGNARQAAEAGGNAPHVTVRTLALGRRATITVRDNGPGIPLEAIPQVFDPFFTTKRAGSGIGLAITRNIIEGLEGTIAVASSDATGTTFVVELPLPPEAAARSFSA
jgi:signal transduction histidine kinase